MEITINRAILHVVGNTNAIYSKTDMDIDSEVCCGFITSHIKRLLNNRAAKSAHFNDGSQVLGIVNRMKEDEAYFKEGSVEICELLQGIMNKHADIPAADLLVTVVTAKNEKYIGILKLNHKECITHKISGDQDHSVNEIVTYYGVLDSAKITEACLIPYDPMVLKVIEKPYMLDGQSVDYFTELFLDCNTEISKKETAQTICNLADEIGEKYYNRSFDKVTELKAVLNEDAQQNEGVVDVYSAAKTVFADNQQAKDEYMEKVKELGVGGDVDLGEKFAQQQFGTHKIKAENGIEIKFPTELFGDEDYVRVVTEQNGTTTIILKNLGKIV